MENKKKIVYLITKSSWGGAQRYLSDLAKRFKNQYNVLVFYGGNEFGGENIFKKKLDKEKIKNKELKDFQRDLVFPGDVKAFVSLIKLFKKEKPDIIHLNSSKAGLLGAVAGRLCGVRKIVFTTHGLPFMQRRAFLKHFLIKLGSLATVFLSTDVICVSKKEFDILNEYGIFRKKIHLIYNGIEEIDFLEREEARKELLKIFPQIGEINLDNLWFGSIAELTATKSIDKSLERLSEMKKEGKDFVYLHFGTGELERGLKEKVAELDLAKNVFWLGFVSEASRYLKAFDTFLLPSQKEGLPYALLEAKFAGITIEANRVGGVDEILRNPKSEFEMENMINKTRNVYDK